MLKMDLSEMDRLKDQLYHSSADADETLYIIKRLQNETSYDDLLKTYSQYEAIADDLVIAEKAIIIIKETLYDLGKTVSDATIMCSDGESEKVNIITRQ